MWRGGSSPRIVMLLCGEENLREVAKALAALPIFASRESHAGPNNVRYWQILFAKGS